VYGELSSTDAETRYGGCVPVTLTTRSGGVLSANSEYDPVATRP